MNFMTIDAEISQSSLQFFSTSKWLIEQNRILKRVLWWKWI